MKYFTKDHEWIEFDGSKASIGISQHAADELGDITYVELPDLVPIKQGEEFTTLESVKAASDIYAPVSGNICKVNDKLSEFPEIINNNAEKDGWICQLSDIKTDELKNLMNENEYKRFIEC